MVSIPARTVDEYLAKLPPEQREVVSAIRQMMQRHMPKGYVEQTGYGMIGWVVPMETTGPTYNGQPLCYAGIAAQKRHYSIYLMGAYMDAGLTRRVQDAFAKAGQRLDMGKSCIRFTSLERIPLEALGPIVAAVPVKEFVTRYQAIHAAPKTGAKKAARASKPAPAAASKRPARKK